MWASRPVVHPAGPPHPQGHGHGHGHGQGQGQGQGQAEDEGDGDVGDVNPPIGMMMGDVPLAPGTPGGLGLRLVQGFFAATGLAVMASTEGFPSITVFRYLVGAATLQCLWSLSLAIVDTYALLVKRSLRNPRATCLFAIGDVITGTLTLAAACASAGITVLISNDMDMCSSNHCARFESATAMTFMSWFALVPSCLWNSWSLVSSIAR